MAHVPQIKNSLCPLETEQETRKRPKPEVSDHIKKGILGVSEKRGTPNCYFLFGVQLKKPRSDTDTLVLGNPATAAGAARSPSVSTPLRTRLGELQSCESRGSKGEQGWKASGLFRGKGRPQEHNHEPYPEGPGTLSEWPFRDKEGSIQCEPLGFRNAPNKSIAH